MAPTGSSHRLRSILMDLNQLLADHPVIDGHNDWGWECLLRRGHSVEGLERGLASDTDIERPLPARFAPAIACSASAISSAARS